MTSVISSGETLGATIEGLDLTHPLQASDAAFIVRTLAERAVLRFPRQTLDAAQLKAFSAHFGRLEINVAGNYQAGGHPEVMILSNIVENGTPIGLADAGQDWHSDMSYSRTIAYANVLHAIRVPQRDGRPLGATLFANMCAAYDDLPPDVKSAIDGYTALHDFAKFWDKMRREKGSTRPALTDEQRRAKPPVSHPMVLVHPISGRKALYANPGYAVRVNELPERESDELLRMLIDHQLQPKYVYTFHWTEGDVLMWDNLQTLHNAVADYGANEHRLMMRCQVMADRVFEPAFAAAAACV